ncbi:MAG: AcrB/AcrD/AcrF family protein [Luteitalea sp.]|nr:AcrB/AcrD/AcrF family protein [Luteitalea sp.]
MKRAIAWFVGNSVAANLVMILILAGGLLTVGSIKKEVFPDVDTNLISVSVAYLGAAPEEVEEGVCVPIEEEIQGVEGIKELTSSSAEGSGTVTVEVEEGYDVREVLDEVKNRVDAIDTFPVEAEEPIIRELLVRRQVLNVAVAGEADEVTLKRLGERVRDEISALPGITQVELAAARPYEISIEVSEETLRRHGLTFDDVARAVRQSSVDLPGGSVKTEGGEILLRAKGRAYRGPEFEKLVLLSRPDGTILRLGDVARVVDGFEETDEASRFDGAPAVLVQVFRVGDQSALDIADVVKEYVALAQASMPEGVALTIWQDDTRILVSRMELLIRNGLAGFALVFIVLTLFLRLGLAFWVSLGIPVSFLGTLWLLPSVDVSINLLSLFAFIVALGIVVDDAIVIGESVYTEQERLGGGHMSAVVGAHRVALPVIFGVLTTVAAFAPMLMLEGQMGKVFRVIPLIVIPTLLFSLVESLIVLPSHLSMHGAGNRGHNGERTTPGEPLAPGRPRRGPFAMWQQMQRRIATALDRWTDRVYRPCLAWAIRWRALTLASGLATLILMVGLVGGGWIRFAFFPPVEADNVAAMLTMPQGTPVETTAAAVRHLEDAALEIKEELERENGTVFHHLLSSVGSQPYRTQQNQGPGRGGAGASFAGSHLGEINIELAPAEARSIGSTALANLWRDRAGPVADAVELTFTASLFDSGEAINVELRGADLVALREAAERLKARLSEYPGVFDIADSFRAGKRELKLAIRPEAEALGLTLTDLGRQVRQGFYGEEAQRIQRGRDEVKVMVRYPQSERRSLGDLENARIRTPQGDEVSFGQVALADHGRGYDTIQRTNRHRAVNVTADVDLSRGNPNEIVANLDASVLPQLMANYPGIQYSFEGEQEQQRETLGGLGRGFTFALLVIYALLAVPLRSYAQPLLIMSAIPFGLVGSVVGHVVLGMELTVLSMLGMVAMAGVVVNSSLVLVDFANRRMREQATAEQAIIEAGVARFRPILLTAMTTFAGLTPLMLERSLQAQFLIPMAVSLAFGVAFSTVVTLVLVPAGYLTLFDVREALARLFFRQPATTAEPQGPTIEPEHVSST